MFDLRTGMSIELTDITEQTFADCRKYGIYSIDPGLSKRFTTDTYARQLENTVKTANEYGVHIRCIHLPYGAGWDISENFAPQRKAAVQAHIEVMRVCRDIVDPDYFVLHPSTEPIENDMRQAHFSHARDSLSVLSEKADNLLIENLPRNCLGNTSDELIDLISPFPNLGICCDLNHLLFEKPQSALSKFGKRVKHLHVSDNDGENERHWLPGDGSIDWTAVLLILRDIGYDGVFNYEVRKYPPEEIAANKRELFNRAFGVLSAAV